MATAAWALMCFGGGLMFGGFLSAAFSDEKDSGYGWKVALVGWIMLISGSIILVN